MLVGGLVVQLAGFVTVWWQIADALRRHGRPSYWKRMRAWWARRSRRIVLAAGTGVVGLSGISARGRVRTPPGDTVDSRLTALEKNFANLESEVDGNRREAEREVAALRTSLTAEAAERAARDAGLEKLIEEHAVGSADWQIVGLVWFIAGSVFSMLSSVTVQ